MALISPGVEIRITEEGTYDSSAPGSIPLIVVATATNKIAASGNGIAPMTVADKAGRLYQATSQRDLVQAFGTPFFYSAGGTSLHGHELNEYGLHAAYSFLGAANSAFILRADIDTASLLPSAIPPVGAPINGTYWFDVAQTDLGLFQSNGNSVPGLAWASKSVLVATTADTILNGSSIYVPKATFGVDGNFAVVVQDTNNYLFEKTSGTWYRVGSTEWK
ncbi:MAG: hypothetical protein EOO77_34985, partial [Oxalobacteraceae bacterium]